MGDNEIEMTGYLVRMENLTKQLEMIKQHERLLSAAKEVIENFDRDEVIKNLTKGQLGYKIHVARELLESAIMTTKDTPCDAG